MNFLKQNFLLLIILIILIINFSILSDIQSNYNNLRSQNVFLQSSIDNLRNNYPNQTQAASPTKPAKEVMTPLDLAQYLGIEISQVYNIANADRTMPYIMVNNEYRFSKAAIDKWMETRKSIIIRQ